MVCILIFRKWKEENKKRSNSNGEYEYLFPVSCERDSALTEIGYIHACNGMCYKKKENGKNSGRTLHIYTSKTI